LIAWGLQNAVDNAVCGPQTGGSDLPAGCHAIATESKKLKLFQCVALREKHASPGFS
jgi:hypothetical protein